jgi:hypothetical protein
VALVPRPLGGPPLSGGRRRSRAGAAAPARRCRLGAMVVGGNAPSGGPQKLKMFLIKHFVANGVHLGHKVDK